MELFEEKNTTETSAPVKRYEGKVFIFSDTLLQEKIIQVLCATFGLDPEGMGDTPALYDGDIEIRLAVVGESVGEQAEEFTKKQVERTCGRSYQVETGVADVKTNLLHQIGRARSFVLVEYASDAEDEEDIEGKRTMIEGMFVSVLNDLEGIILTQNQEEKEDSMFCCGENGEKLLILSDKGGGAFTRYLPYQEPDLKAGKDITQEQVDQRMRTMQTFIGNAIYVSGWLPAVESASQITCFSLEETAKRALAITGVATYSECLLDEKQGVEKAQDFLVDYIDNNNTQSYFSPREWRYLHDMAPDRKGALSFLRQYESFYVVEWALGLVEELGFPNHPCNPADLVRSLRNGTSISKIVAKSRSKSSRELLDAYDLTFCLKWPYISARCHELPEPAGMKTGVVGEWHKALNQPTGHGQWGEARANSQNVSVKRQMKMKTGIIAEGGGMRGIYAAGVLDVLLERGIKANGLVGVSTSAIHGCNFVAGQAGRSVRYDLKYYRDPRYMNFRSLVTTGDSVGNEFCYHELPERLGPFDNDAFEASPTEPYVTCTGVETGRPMYHRCDSLRGGNIQWIWASASMPLVFRTVEIDGHKLLDEGVSDSIPVAAFRKMGFGRNLVILTQPDGYHKKPNHMLPATRKAYHRYPEFIKTMECRHLMCNRELEEVRHMEAAEETFVIRPSHPIKISRIENRPEKTQQMYELGRPDGMKALRDTAGFSGVEPVVCG